MHEAHRMDRSPVQCGGFLAEGRTFVCNFPEKLCATGWSYTVHLTRESTDSCCNVSDQLNVRAIILVDIRGHHVDVNQIALLSQIPETGFKFYGIVADRNYQVCRVEDSIRGLRAKEAHSPAESIEVLPRDHSRPLVGAHDRHLCLSNKFSHSLSGVFFARKQP